MSAPHEIRFETDAAFVKRGARRFCLRSGWRSLLARLAFMTLFIALSIASRRSLKVRVLYSFALVAAVMVVPEISRYRRLVRAAGRLDDRISLRLDNAGMEVASSAGLARLSWRAFDRIWKYADMWLLVAGRGYLPLPTSALTDEARAFLDDRVRIGKTRGKCARCGYDLRALTASRCPECGEAFDPQLEAITGRGCPGGAPGGGERQPADKPRYEVEFTFSPEMQRSVANALAWAGLPRSLLNTALGLGLGLLVVRLASGGRPLSWQFLVVVMLSYSAAAYALKYRRVLRRKDFARDQVVRLVFDDVGFRAQGDLGEREVPWSEVLSLRVINGFWLIFTKSVCQIVPASVLSPELQKLIRSGADRKRNTEINTQRPQHGALDESAARS